MNSYVNTCLFVLALGGIAGCPKAGDLDDVVDSDTDYEDDTDVLPPVDTDDSDLPVDSDTDGTVDTQVHSDTDPVGL